MFNGANGPLNGVGSTCGVIVAVGLAVTVIGVDAVTGAARVRARAAGLEVELVTRNTLGDCSGVAVDVGLSCGRENVEIADVVPCNDVLGALLVPPFGDEIAGVTGAWSSSTDVLEVVGADSYSTVVCDSGVDAFSEEGPPVCVDGVDDVEDVEASGFFSVDDAAEESAAPVEADDVALESVGSATASPGVAATAHPTPSATANAPTRPTYLT